jgi:hypothetical protein
MNRFHLLALASVVTVASSGCIVTTTATPPSNGTFELDWTINGQVASSLCNQSASANISITINRASGGAVGTYTQACSAFATYVDLAPGNYTFGAALVDGAGTARTTTATGNFVVYSNTRTTQSVDFPPSSFF